MWFIHLLIYFLHFISCLSRMLLCLHHLACFFIRKCFVGFILTSTALCPASPWFFHRKPFVLSKQALVCASHSKLQQGCQVSIPTPARSSCSSGPEQHAGAVYAVLLPYGPLVQQARGRSHERKCLPCWLEVLKPAAC